jgi:branched-chain amino acid aminotransferase
MTVPSRMQPLEPTAMVASEENPQSAIWVNGELQPWTGVHVSARDRGLLLADGVFETMRVSRGAVFRLDRHLERLSHGLRALAVREPAELRDWVLAAVRSAVPGDASIRLTVSRGIGAPGVAPPVDTRPTVIVALNPMPVFAAAVYDAGLTAHVVSGRRNERAMTAGLKTLAYTDAIAGLLEARQAGADEALFLDTDAHCSEASASNLFAWTGSMLVTPPLSCGALPGITRATVLELAAGLGIAAAERPFGLDGLLDAQEAFLTSSLRGIAPLVRVDARPIGRGTPGALTRRLARAYDALVAQECGV